MFIDQGKGAQKAGTEGRVYIITKAGAWRTSCMTSKIDLSRTGGCNHMLEGSGMVS